MTLQEIRLEAMRIVWPKDGASADAQHFIAKARAIEAYITEGITEQAPVESVTVKSGRAAPKR